jgi:hypothetical protein
MTDPVDLRDLMPLAVLLGIELLDAEPDLLRGRLSWTPETCTGRRVDARRHADGPRRHLRRRLCVPGGEVTQSQT